MKSDEPYKGFFNKLLLKVKNPITAVVIALLYILNNHFEVIKAKEILFAVCVILVCIVFLRDTIYKCVQAICKMNVDIEKEKTKQKEIESNNVSNGDVKIYSMKRDKNKRA